LLLEIVFNLIDLFANLEETTPDPSEGELGVVSEELKAVFCCVDVFLG
jgi:hypothetical protein